MNDDAERRLRDALSAANLPGAPASLRASMRAIASGSAPAPSRGHRPWLRALPALAAVVVVAVAAGVLSGGFGRAGPVASAPGSAAAASGETPALSPAPPSSSAMVPSPDPSSSPAAGYHVYTPSELGLAPAADRGSLVGQVVLVDGSIDTSIVSTCHPDPASCPIGRLAGTTEIVSATPYTSQLLAGIDINANTVKAMVVRSSGLEYLGWMGSAGGSGFQATVADLASTAANPPNGPITFIVKAWLGTSGPLPCPYVPGSPPPDDTPFGSGCPYSWLASTNGLSAPDGAVPVQYGAYQDFAPGATLPDTQPRFGTYLVRLVVDTRQGADGPRGWQVVARLAP